MTNKTLPGQHKEKKLFPNSKYYHFLCEKVVVQCCEFCWIMEECGDSCLVKLTQGETPDTAQSSTLLILSDWLLKSFWKLTFGKPVGVSKNNFKIWCLLKLSQGKHPLIVRQTFSKISKLRFGKPIRVPQLTFGKLIPPTARHLVQKVSKPNFC